MVCLVLFLKIFLRKVFKNIKNIKNMFFENSSLLFKLKFFFCFSVFYVVFLKIKNKNQTYFFLFFLSQYFLEDKK